MKIRVLFVSTLVITIAFAACKGSKKGEAPAPAKSPEGPKSAMKPVMGPVAVVKPATSKTAIPAVPAVHADDLATDAMVKVYAGFRAALDKKDAPIVGFHLWKDYARRMAHAWKQYVAKRVVKMRTWSAKQLTGPRAARGVIFYPFSGADILYPEIFFPTSSEVVMIGLEPAGTLMDLRAATTEDVVGYVHQIESTIQHITQLTFFRTNTMRKQMFHDKVQRINGTLPTILFFLARLGYTVEGLERVTISSEGKVESQGRGSSLRKPGEKVRVVMRPQAMRADTMEAMQMKSSMDMDGMTPESMAKAKSKGMGMHRRRLSMKAKKKHRRRKARRAEPVYTVTGNRIQYRRPDGSRGRVTYFSANLSDGAFRDRAGLDAMKPLVAYIRGLTVGVTYLKGASYLMYRPYFSRIRGLILQRSAWVLQDDSGLPVHHFLREWENHFFGRYHKPIKLFRERFQPQLFALYNAKGRKIPALPFGIGYSIYSSRSNLHLARKMSAKEVEEYKPRYDKLMEWLKTEAENAKKMARDKAKAAMEAGAPGAGAPDAVAPGMEPAMKPSMKAPAKGGAPAMKP